MSEKIVFSYAENADGKMVHVDSVLNGDKCNCKCPHCKAPLVARHGEYNTHGFAHNDKTRKADLKICYMVSLYKLAEQIIQEKKKIRVPSYYGIFKEKDIEFVDVKVDVRYEREDKQPDVIATTADNKQYIIEFTFGYKVQHKQMIDYKGLNCLEINLSKQTHGSLEDFLLKDTSDKKWLNNTDYFGNIESAYKNEQKFVKVKGEDECNTCELKYNCTGVKSPNTSLPLVIENNGKKYRICKIEQYKVKLEEFHRRQEEHKEYLKQELVPITQVNKLRPQASIEPQQQTANKFSEINNSPIDSNERTCFNCKNNLKWGNKDGLAYCGCHNRAGVPQKTPPYLAKECKLFNV